MSDQELQPEQANGHVNRDAKGRLLPGHRLGLGGRPRGFDLRTIVQEKAKAEGISLEDALWDVVRTLFEAARKGDVAAAKLILDRLCDNETLALGGVVLRVVTGVGRDQVEATTSVVITGADLLQ